MIGAAGLVFPYALLLWGYTGFTEYQSHQDIAQAERQLTALWQISAQKQCFVR
jgi:hypothetical protein